MANTYPFAAKPTHKFSIAASDSSSTLVIGSGSKRIASSFLVHIVVTSGTLSIAVKARSCEVQAGRGNDDVAFAATPYCKQHLNGSAGDMTYVTTAITGTSIIIVPASGLEIAL